VSRYDWLLFLHVLSAFALVGSVVVFGVVLLAARGGGEGAAGALRLTPLGQRLSEVGGLGTLVLGIWLAIDLDDYGLFDDWVIEAVLLWAIAAGTGARVGVILGEARGGGDAAIGGRATMFFGIAALAVVALLAVMIYKPGA
jgi:hypothetical protein